MFFIYSSQNMFTKKFSKSIGIWEIELFQYFFCFESYLGFRSTFEFHHVFIWIVLDFIIELGLVLLIL